MRKITVKNKNMALTAPLLCCENGLKRKIWVLVRRFYGKF